VFDKAGPEEWQEIPLSVGIQALAAAQSSASAAGIGIIDTMGGMGASAAGSGAAGGRGALGGVTPAAGGAVGAVTNTAANVGGAAGGAVNSAAGAGGSIAGTSKGAVGGLNAAGQLTSKQPRRVWPERPEPERGASNATQGSVITSAGKNVRLDSGTRMLLVSQAQASSQGEARQPAAASRNQKVSPSRKPASQQTIKQERSASRKGATRETNPRGPFYSAYA